jgi:hypothetical protein
MVILSAFKGILSHGLFVLAISNRSVGRWRERT